MTGALRGMAFDAVMGWIDVRGFASVRREVCAPAVGAVLEIGGGTGANLRHFRQASSVSVLEPDADLHPRLARRASRIGPPFAAHVAAAESIPFADGTFDTVVATLVLCSVDDPAAAVAEIRRVLTPGGTLRFAEHVRSPDPTRAAVQDRWAPLWRRCAGGCHANRDTLATIADGGFSITFLRRGQMAGAPRIVRPMIVGIAGV